MSLLERHAFRPLVITMGVSCTFTWAFPVVEGANRVLGKTRHRIPKFGMQIRRAKHELRLIKGAMRGEGCVFRHSCPCPSLGPPPSLRLSSLLGFGCTTWSSRHPLLVVPCSFLFAHKLKQKGIRSQNKNRK